MRYITPWKMIKHFHLHRSPLDSKSRSPYIVCRYCRNALSSVFGYGTASSFSLKNRGNAERLLATELSISSVMEACSHITQNYMKTQKSHPRGISSVGCVICAGKCVKWTYHPARKLIERYYVTSVGTCS